MICARKAPSCGFLFLKGRLRSHSLVKSLLMLSYTSNGNQFIQSHKPAVACGRSLFNSRSSDSDSSIHSYKKTGESAEKVIDDELDLSIDLENELKWLSDRVRNSTIQSARDYSKNPLADPQETRTRGPQKDLPLLNHQLSLNVLPQNSRPVEGRVFSYYCEQCASVSSDHRPPPLTTDVAVEVVTGELQSVFGLNRYYAHRIASWLRRPYYSSRYNRGTNKTHLPPALDTGPSATEALVARTRDTIQALHQLGASPWLLIRLPMLVKISSRDLAAKASLLVGPGLFSQVSEGLPMLLVPLINLKDDLASLRAESCYLSQHRNRLYLMAEALNVCVVTVGCGVAAAGASNIINMELVKLARAIDTFNYYRMDRRYVLTHMNVFLLSLSMVRHRYDLMVRATNPPNVVAALHAASLLPAHARATISLMLEDCDTGSTAGHSSYTDDAGGCGNKTGQNGKKSAAAAVALRVGNCSSEALKVSSDEFDLKESKAGCNGAAAVDDPLAEHAHFLEGESHSGFQSEELLETISNDIITTPAINDRACSTATACSLSAAEIEEVLKDYVPPPIHSGRKCNSEFRTLYNRALERSSGLRTSGST